jgi:hypothetical protein
MVLKNESGQPLLGWYSSGQAKSSGKTLANSFFSVRSYAKKRSCRRNFQNVSEKLSSMLTRNNRALNLSRNKLFSNWDGAKFYEGRVYYVKRWVMSQNSGN